VAELMHVVLFDFDDHLTSDELIVQRVKGLVADDLDNGLGLTLH
jgi:hypothetical protein